MSTRALKELPRKSKILKELNLDGSVLEFHGPDSFNTKFGFCLVHNKVCSAFFNDLKDVDIIELNGVLFDVVRNGYEDTVSLVKLKGKR